MTNKIAPFAIATHGLTERQVADAFDKCVLAGATLREGTFFNKTRYPFTIDGWVYFGVDSKGCTRFEDSVDDFSYNATELTLDQLDVHLGLTSSPEETPLRNVKIDLRREDGTIDEEKFAAFQEAVFASGGKWLGSGTSYQKPCAFIYVNESGIMTLGNGNPLEEAVFKSKPHREIDFTYTRKLEYTASLKGAPRAVVNVRGVDYYEDELMKALEMIKPVK